MCEFAFELHPLWAEDSSHGWSVDVFSGLKGAAKMPLQTFVDLTQDTISLTHQYLSSLRGICQQEKQHCSSALAFPMHHLAGGCHDPCPLVVIPIIPETQAHMENLWHNHHPKLDS